jgi:hypothetical protein
MLEVTKVKYLGGWDIWFLLNGSHTALAYSVDGLTSVVYAASLTSFGHACMLRLRKPIEPGAVTSIISDLKW